MLEEVACGESLIELLVRDEPVLAAVLLSFAALPGRRGNGQLELGQLGQQGALEGALAGARGPGDDEDRADAAATCGRAQ